MAVIALLGSVLIHGAALAAQSAVIFMYHRFGENEYPSTSIRLEQFEDHLKALKKGNFTVWPVPRIIAALKAGQDLPDRTIGITIDDAYLSVFTEAWPRFKAAGIPFSVFVATDPVDRKVGGYMTWEHLRELKAAGVTIEIEEDRLPLREEVKGMCEILGLDPLYLANEGTLVLFVPADQAEAAIGAMRRTAAGQGAVAIGRAVTRAAMPVVMKTSFGGSRIVDMLVGEQLPRIC